jgi:hypothetical protein
MPFTFTQTQLEQIEALVQQAEDEQILFADVYEHVADLITSNSDDDVERVER